mmetsp:Transcript_41254/g.104007  ORF Transcript_41254/g.104007 Transcript_41254/m.104007 type:complete len:312 (+) Transcript_41254:4836-5771(+)
MSVDVVAQLARALVQEKGGHRHLCVHQHLTQIVVEHERPVQHSLQHAILQATKADVSESEVVKLPVEGRVCRHGQEPRPPHGVQPLQELLEHGGHHGVLGQQAMQVSQRALAERERLFGEHRLLLLRLWVLEVAVGPLRADVGALLLNSHCHGAVHLRPCQDRHPVRPLLNRDELLDLLHLVFGQPGPHADLQRVHALLVKRVHKGLAEAYEEATYDRRDGCPAVIDVEPESRSAQDRIFRVVLQNPKLGVIQADQLANDAAGQSVGAQRHKDFRQARIRVCVRVQIFVRFMDEDFCQAMSDDVDSNTLLH